MPKQIYYVYIMANKSGSTYVGVTSDIERRALDHKRRKLEGFTKKYKIDLLVFFEEFQYVEDAIKREKQIKGWRKEKKRELVESLNPKWVDLSEDWFE